LLSLIAPAVQADDKLNYKQVDERTYELFIAESWRELIDFGNQALDQDIDFFYLRMRMGIACIKLQKFIDAARHFTKAIEFNAYSDAAREYLYYSYLNSGNKFMAREVKNKSPQKIQLKLQEEFTEKRHFSNLETGFIISNLPEKMDAIDLDGVNDIYGEATYLNNGWYINAGANAGIFENTDVYFGYTFFELSKTKKIIYHYQNLLEDNFTQRQHQFYVNAKIYLGKGFTLMPAFNYINLTYETIFPRYVGDVAANQYDRIKVEYNNVIGYLSLNKDYGKIKTGLFGAYSNLNDLDQYQYGINLTVFPFGGLQFYSTTSLLNHNNNGKNNFIIDQLFGIQLSKKWWLEVFATIGNLENYHEDAAFTVYNIPDKIKFKCGGKLIWNLNSSIRLNLQYLFLLRQEQYVQYVFGGLDGTEITIIPAYKSINYSNHIISGGIIWNF